MMEPQARPVGLTVFAGILFVIAAIDVLGTFFFGVGFVGHIDARFSADWIPPEMINLFRAAPLWYVAAGTFVLWPVKIGLLVTAGLAFLAQKRRGLVLANLYVGASLIESVVTAVALGADVRTLLGALFPCFVFLAVNKIFAEDLKH